MTPTEEKLTADVKRLALVVDQLYSRVRQLEKPRGIVVHPAPQDELTGHAFHTEKP